LRKIKLLKGLRIKSIKNMYLIEEWMQRTDVFVAQRPAEGERRAGTAKAEGRLILADANSIHWHLQE
jgi:hypothetical protein